MCDKTPDELVATRDGVSKRAPARRLAQLLQCTCLVGCGTLFAIPVGLVLIVLVWQWRLNRNPDPFPWRPAREWTLRMRPKALDFVEQDGSLIILCDEGRFGRAPGTSVVRCDVETGKILSEHVLPFPVAALAVSPNSNSVLIAGVPPAPHDRIPRRSGERLALRRHVLRIATLRLPDWSVEAEIEEEIKYSGSSYDLAHSLRLLAMPARRAWVVGIDGPEGDEYRVSLRDEKTLVEIGNRSVPSQPHSRCRTIALDPKQPSRVLIGRRFLIGRVVTRDYRWDSWDTDSGDATFAKVPHANSLPLPSPSPSVAGWIFGLPQGIRLSDLVVYDETGGQLVFRVGASRLNAISWKGVFAASVRNSQSEASMPVPVPPVRTALAIWSLAPEKLIVAGKLQGKENAITTLRFSRDNRFLVTGHQGGTIRVWELPRDPGDVPPRDGDAESSTHAPRTDRFRDESPLASSDETRATAQASAPPLAVAPLDAETARQHQEAWAKHLGLEVEIENSIGMKLVLIPPGEFLMGSPASEARGLMHEPQHRVRITKPYYLGMYEVTQGQWERVMAWNPSQFKGAQLPVEGVSWEDAKEFCRKLSARSEERPAGRVYRLPTEAEWEHACRAGTTTRFSFGDDEAGLGEYGWFRNDSGGQTHPVGRKKPNAWGLHDMHGNVWEWCDEDPLTLWARPDRVIRGGSWDSFAGHCRSACRFRLPASRRGNDREIRPGFRVARSLSGQ